MGLAGAGAATYNSAMERRDRWVAFGLASATALATLVPYWIAGRLAPPGTAFAGFLLNPVDGFSYLAKMRQGLGGSWLFHLPYAADPGRGAFLYPYYLLLGHIARVTRLDLIMVLHAARTVSAIVMFLAIYRCLEEFLSERRERWLAFALCLVGAGWGWAAVPVGFVASDLSIPETTPFLTAYANAHFPLAAAGFLAAVVGVLGSRPGARRWTAASLAGGMLIAVVLPFILLPALVVLTAGTLILAGEERRAGAASSLRARIVGLAAFLAGAAPFVAYDAWLLFSRPDLAGWSAQNRTPSPSPLAYVLGFAPLLLLTAVALLWTPRPAPRLWLLAGWAGVQVLLLYAPLALQRRLSLGLFVALAGLAALGLTALARRGVSWRIVATLALASAIPSNLLVIAAGVGGVQRGEPSLVQSTDEACASDWLAAHAPAGSLVLAGETLGNRLPAQADVRVLYGHPFETPDAAAELSLVEWLLAGSTSLTDALPVLLMRGVDYVVVGPEERSLGPASWPADLPEAVQCGGVSVFVVPPA